MVAFKAVSYGLVGLLALTVLILSVVSLRREIIAGNPLNGLLPVVLFIAALCAFIALLSAYVQFHQVTSILLQSGDGWNQFSTMSSAGEHCSEIF